MWKNIGLEQCLSFINCQLSPGGDGARRQSGQARHHHFAPDRGWHLHGGVPTGGNIAGESPAAYVVKSVFLWRNQDPKSDEPKLNGGVYVAKIHH